MLKKAAEKWLPKPVIWQQKRGLSVPVASWLNGGLRGEVDRMLEPSRLKSQGLVDAQYVSELVAAHRAHRANHAKPLWALVMLQYWLENWAAA